MKMNRYKMKPGISISDIERYAEESGKSFGTAGKWVSEDAEYLLIVPLNLNFDVDVVFPKNIENWDDSKHILVMEDSAGQPCGWLNHYRKNPTEEEEPSLHLIELFNEKMDELPFLIRDDSF